MKILLIQPGFGQGLGFQRTALVEPLGLEMVASSLLERGHEVRILDLRIEKNLEKTVRDFAPSLCGINCSFTIDVYKTSGEIGSEVELVPSTLEDGALGSGHGG